MPLSGRVAVVTGSSRGIGRACALALARVGLKVVVAAKSTEETDRLPGTIYSVAREVEELGGEALPVACDVRDRANVRALIARTVETFGRLDVLVCNAGALWWKPLTETPEKRYDLVMRVNLDATFFACQEAIPHMRENGWGHVVTMSPPLGPAVGGAPEVGWIHGRIAYGVSKLGMTLIALGLAEELRDDGIAANALWPVTMIETQATRNWSLGDPSMWRTPEIVADALVAIVRHDPRELTGRTLLDEPFLRSLGVTDFEKYSVVPGSEIPPLERLWSMSG